MFYIFFLKPTIKNPIPFTVMGKMITFDEFGKNMAIIPPKNAGQKLADAHQSVKRGINTKKVYDTLTAALSHSPEVQGDDRAAIRMKALLYSLNRVEGIAERKNENFRVSGRDHMRMDKEFEYLKERTLRLVSDTIYPSNLAIDDESTGFSPALGDSIAFRMEHLMNAVYEGDYKTKNQPNLEKVFNEIARDTYKGDLSELGISLGGPIGLYTRNIPIIHSVNDMREELSSIPYNSDGEIDANWVKEATDRVRVSLLEDPQRAIASQIDGIENTGRIEISL